MEDLGEHFERECEDFDGDVRVAIQEIVDGNALGPIVDKYGGDAMRMYEMFMGPLEQVKPWNMQGVEGVSRFLAKVWRIAMTVNQEGEWEPGNKLGNGEAEQGLLKVVHATIRKVGEDVEKLRFNRSF